MQLDFTLVKRLLFLSLALVGLLTTSASAQTEERVVVSKETVPVEKVSLGTETVTEQQDVTETVRKEQIELDDDSDTVGADGISDVDEVPTAR